jgi:hypothetical protein
MIMRAGGGMISAGPIFVVGPEESNCDVQRKNNVGKEGGGGGGGGPGEKKPSSIYYKF